LLIGVGIVVVIIVGFLIFDRLRPLDVPLPDGYDTKYDNFPQSTTEEGYALLGNPNAPIEVREYAAFGCPHCGDLHKSDIDPLLKYIESGDAKLVYIPISNIAANAEETARAGVCALEQGRFWEMHDIMFYWQQRVSSTERRLKEAADKIGLDTDQFNKCFNSANTDNVLNRALNEFASRGLTGTPSVYVNGTRLDNPTSLYETVRDQVGG
jgi:protein-disulfide isomerase